MGILCNTIFADSISLENQLNWSFKIPTERRKWYFPIVFLTQWIPSYHNILVLFILELFGFFILEILSLFLAKPLNEHSEFWIENFYEFDEIDLFSIDYYFNIIFRSFFSLWFLGFLQRIKDTLNPLIR